MKTYTLFALGVAVFAIVLNLTIYNVSFAETSCVTYLNTTLKIGSRGTEVKKFQQTLKDAGYNIPKVDGVFGKITEKARVAYYKKCPKFISGPNDPVISGVAGPQQVGQNQPGTWTVTASSKTGATITYSVDWGDTVVSDINKDTLTINLQQDRNFKHTYTTPGIFHPVFTVISPNTIACIKAPCSSNAGSAQATMTINVIPVVVDNFCEYAAPPAGYHWEGIQPWPTCGGRLVPDSNSTLPAGCTSAEGYSTTTGQSCHN